MLDPLAAAFEEGLEDGVSGPDSGPEVKGEAGRADAYRRERNVRPEFRSRNDARLWRNPILQNREDCCIG
jgi:hypothetical protein